MHPAGRLQAWISETVRVIQKENSERDYIGFQEINAGNTLVIKIMLEDVTTRGESLTEQKL